MGPKLEKLLKDFKDRYKYSLVEINDDLEYVVFKRIVERNKTHTLTLEDHRWELEMSNFDPDTDIGDWLIFSELENSERDWFGHFIPTQYPLTLSEYKFIEEIIKELEKESKGE